MDEAITGGKNYGRTGRGNYDEDYDNKNNNIEEEVQQHRAAAAGGGSPCTSSSSSSSPRVRGFSLIRGRYDGGGADDGLSEEEKEEGRGRRGIGGGRGSSSSSSSPYNNNNLTMGGTDGHDEVGGAGGGGGSGGEEELTTLSSSIHRGGGTGTTADNSLLTQLERASASSQISDVPELPSMIPVTRNSYSRSGYLHQQQQQHMLQQGGGPGEDLEGVVLVDPPMNTSDDEREEEEVGVGGVGVGVGVGGGVGESEDASVEVELGSPLALPATTGGGGGGGDGTGIPSTVGGGGGDNHDVGGTPPLPPPVSPAAAASSAPGVVVPPAEHQQQQQQQGTKQPHRSTKRRSYNIQGQGVMNRHSSINSINSSLLSSATSSNSSLQDTMGAETAGTGGGVGRNPPKRTSYGLASSVASSSVASSSARRQSGSSQASSGGGSAGSSGEQRGGSHPHRGPHGLHASRRKSPAYGGSIRRKSPSTYIGGTGRGGGTGGTSSTSSSPRDGSQHSNGSASMRGSSPVLQSIRAKAPSILKSIRPIARGGGPGGGGSNLSDSLSHGLSSSMAKSGGGHGHGHGSGAPHGGGDRGGGGGGSDLTIIVEDFASNREKALDALSSNQASEWENMAAAAAVVAGGATASDTRHHRRYGVGDKVLVFLSAGRQAQGPPPPGPGGLGASSMMLHGGHGGGGGGGGGGGLGGSMGSSMMSSGGNGGPGTPIGGSLNRGISGGGFGGYYDDDDEAFHMANGEPVNKLGFPRGKGDTEDERKGPYVYVLAVVKKVHFEEDARYYTVVREDTKTEQRADTEWMEPVLSAKGEIAAMKAAHTIVKHNDTRKGSRDNKQRSLTRGAKESRFFKYCCVCAFCLDRIIGCGRTLGLCLYRQVFPKCSKFWHRVYRGTKTQARLVLNGLEPYECKIRFTMVNILVLCSIIFMFLDQIRLAFFKGDWDDQIVVVELIVWLILACELFFEVMIRPDGYSALIHSEKAYAPSTSRYINRFHLCMEIVALALYLPELMCVFWNVPCGTAIPGTLIFASLRSVLGPTRTQAFAGHAIYAFVRLRIFGLVRHWKQMWIHAALMKQARKETFCRGFLMPPREDKEAKYAYKQHHQQQHVGATKKVTPDINSVKENEDESAISDGDEQARANASKRPSLEEDLRLKNAATIGTALLVINSHRAMLLLVAIVGLLPIINTIRLNGGTNIATTSMVEMMQANNLIAPTSSPFDCGFLEHAVESWVKANAFEQRKSPTGNANLNVSLLYLQVLPVRCDWQRGPNNDTDTDGVVTATICHWNETIEEEGELCKVWQDGNGSTTTAQVAQEEGIREGVVVVRTEKLNVTVTPEFGFGTVGQTVEYSVMAYFNEQHTVAYANLASFLLQVSLVMLILIGLSVLRVDAGRLVLNPLRRMLKIVLRYAENPLAPAPRKSGKGKGGSAADDDDYDDSDNEDKDKEDQLGHYETEQLINAITKITDLLRKCWGVAGAGIISSNLARTEEGQTAVFNPCVPGRLVYALFGFVGINDFSLHLRVLDQDVMILINDVARVVHGEVFRWGFGDTGQCNKNLGNTFLMVFRIGDSKEVQEKKNRATEVIFSSAQRKKTGYDARRRRLKLASKVSATSSQGKKKIAVRRRKMSDLMSESSSLQLASLPGISAFTDRAVIGMLKSFAGVYRDKNLQNWKEDFRLGAGVGAFSVDMIFGMDAGWAVEGAVGSEYKIDATYLSPHVNMAARMMSATKQYGIHLLVSQAVEELLSDTARSKLRHIDTVTVKGSSLRQKIYTYDMRHKGVDFFLFDRSEKDADLDADCYSPSIWNTDQDLKAMRQHVSQEFLVEFNFGRDQYLAGNWKAAVDHLKKADDIMIKTVVDEGYIEEYIEDVTEGLISKLMDKDDMSNPEVCRLRNEIGDGPSRCLIGFIERRNCEAPAGWAGYRPLTSK